MDRMPQNSTNPNDVRPSVPSDFPQAGPSPRYSYMGWSPTLGPVRFVNAAKAQSYFHQPLTLPGALHGSIAHQLITNPQSSMNPQAHPQAQIPHAPEISLGNFPAQYVLQNSAQPTQPAQYVLPNSAQPTQQAQMTHAPEISLGNFPAQYVLQNSAQPTQPAQYVLPNSAQPTQQAQMQHAPEISLGNFPAQYVLQNSSQPTQPAQYVLPNSAQPTQQAQMPHAAEISLGNFPAQYVLQNSSQPTQPAQYVLPNSAQPTQQAQMQHAPEMSLGNFPPQYVVPNSSPLRQPLLQQAPLNLTSRIADSMPFVLQPAQQHSRQQRSSNRKLLDLKGNDSEKKSEPVEEPKKISILKRIQDMVLSYISFGFNKSQIEQKSDSKICINDQADENHEKCADETRAKTSPKEKAQCSEYTKPDVSSSAEAQTTKNTSEIDLSKLKCGIKGSKPGDKTGKSTTKIVPKGTRHRLKKRFVPKCSSQVTIEDEIEVDANTDLTFIADSALVRPPGDSEAMVNTVTEDPSLELPQLKRKTKGKSRQENGPVQQIEENPVTIDLSPELQQVKRKRKRKSKGKKGISENAVPVDLPNEEGESTEPHFEENLVIDRPLEPEQLKEVERKRKRKPKAKRETEKNAVLVDLSQEPQDEWEIVGRKKEKPKGSEPAERLIEERQVDQTKNMMKMKSKKKATKIISNQNESIKIEINETKSTVPENFSKPQKPSKPLNPCAKPFIPSASNSSAETSPFSSKTNPHPSYGQAYQVDQTKNMMKMESKKKAKKIISNQNESIEIEINETKSTVPENSSLPQKPSKPLNPYAKPFIPSASNSSAVPHPSYGQAYMNSYPGTVYYTCNYPQNVSSEPQIPDVEHFNTTSGQSVPHQVSGSSPNDWLNVGELISNMTYSDFSNLVASESENVFTQNPFDFRKKDSKGTRVYNENLGCFYENCPEQPNFVPNFCFLYDPSTQVKAGSFHQEDIMESGDSSTFQSQIKNKDHSKPITNYSDLYDRIREQYPNVVAAYPLLSLYDKRIKEGKKYRFESQNAEYKPINFIKNFMDDIPDFFQLDADRNSQHKPTSTQEEKNQNCPDTSGLDTTALYNYTWSCPSLKTEPKKERQLTEEEDDEELLKMCMPPYNTLDGMNKMKIDEPLTYKLLREGIPVDTSSFAQSFRETKKIMERHHNPQKCFPCLLKNARNAYQETQGEHPNSDGHHDSSGHHNAQYAGQQNFGAHHNAQFDFQQNFDSQYYRQHNAGAQFEGQKNVNAQFGQQNVGSKFNEQQNFGMHYDRQQNEGARLTAPENIDARFKAQLNLGAYNLQQKINALFDAQKKVNAPFNGPPNEGALFDAQQKEIDAQQKVNAPFTGKPNEGALFDAQQNVTGFFNEQANYDGRQHLYKDINEQQNFENFDGRQRLYKDINKQQNFEKHFSRQQSFDEHYVGQRKNEYKDINEQQKFEKHFSRQQNFDKYHVGQSKNDGQCQNDGQCDESKFPPLVPNTENYKSTGINASNDNLAPEEPEDTSKPTENPAPETNNENPQQTSRRKRFNRVSANQQKKLNRKGVPESTMQKENIALEIQSNFKTPKPFFQSQYHGRTQRKDIPRYNKARKPFDEVPTASKFETHATNETTNDQQGRTMSKKKFQRGPFRHQSKTYENSSYSATSFDQKYIP